MDYIWLDSETPILNQVPRGFQSAAILLHPFVQMPLRWSDNHQESPGQFIYPNNEEIITYGSPVSWNQVMNSTDLNTYQEVALALKTSISALRVEYAREDLADKLNANLHADLYYPTDDGISVFLVDNILKVLSSNGSNKVYFSAPIFQKSGWLEISDTTPVGIADLTPNELILTDENNDHTFMTMYDSFVTVYLSRVTNIGEIIKSMKWEAIECHRETYINWYLQR